MQNLHVAIILIYTYQHGDYLRGGKFSNIKVGRFTMYANVKCFHVIDTVIINGCYVQEQRYRRERRKAIKRHSTSYERRLDKRRHHPLKIDIQV